jgi:hypothetical protein
LEASIKPPPAAFPTAAVDIKPVPDARPLGDQIESGLNIPTLPRTASVPEPGTETGALPLTGQIENGGSVTDLSDLGLDSEGVDLDVPESPPMPEPEAPSMDDPMLQKFRLVVEEAVAPLREKIEVIESQITVQGESGTHTLKSEVEAIEGVVIPILEQIATEELDPDSVQATVQSLAGGAVKIDNSEVEARMASLESNICSAKDEDSQARLQFAQTLESLQQQLTRINEELQVEDEDGKHSLKEKLAVMEGMMNEGIFPVLDQIAPESDAGAVQGTITAIAREAVEGMMAGLATEASVDAKLGQATAGLMTEEAVDAKLVQATADTKKDIGDKVKGLFTQLKTETDQKVAAADANAEAAKESVSELGTRLEESERQLRAEAENGFEAARAANKGIDNDLQAATAALREEMDEKLDAHRSTISESIESMITSSRWLSASWRQG